MLNFTYTQDAAQVHGVKICIHGRAGVGKTHIVRTLPEPILLSAEAGVLSLRDVRIPQITISSFQEMEEAYNFLTLSEHAKGFQSVALDSISEIAEQCLSHFKAVKKDGRAAYGEMQDEMSKWIRKFRDLPGFHVYFSAKQEYTQNEMNQTKFGPSMPGRKMTQDMPYFFDELFSLELGQTPEGVVYRYLRTKPDLQYEAKDRSGVLDEIEEPHLGKVINKILAGTTQPQEA